MLVKPRRQSQGCSVISKILIKDHHVECCADMMCYADTKAKCKKNFRSLICIMYSDHCVIIYYALQCEALWSAENQFHLKGDHSIHLISPSIFSCRFFCFRELNQPWSHKSALLAPGLHCVHFNVINDQLSIPLLGNIAMGFQDNFVWMKSSSSISVGIINGGLWTSMLNFTSSDQQV